MSASEFKYLCVSWQFRDSIEDPFEPAIRIRAEALMDGDSCIEVGRVLVLIGLEVVLVGEFGHFIS